MTPSGRHDQLLGYVFLRRQPPGVSISQDEGPKDDGDGGVCGHYADD